MCWRDNGYSCGPRDEKLAACDRAVYVCPVFLTSVTLFGFGACRFGRGKAHII